MKVIQCENCKSVDMVRRDGIWICQACGTQYEPGSDLKRVTIDYSEDLQRLYKAARRAKDLGNYDGAQRYYDEILGKNPDSWEAVFNTIYLRFMQCTIGEIPGNARKMQDTLPEVVNLIRDEYESEPDVQDAALIQTEKDIIQLVNLFERGADYYRQKREEFANAEVHRGARMGYYGSPFGLSSSLSGLLDSHVAKVEHQQTRYQIAMMLVALGTSIESTYGDELNSRNVAKGVMIDSWESALGIGQSMGTKFDLQDRCLAMIRKWEPEYKTYEELEKERAARAEAERREKERAAQEAQRQRAAEEAAAKKAARDEFTSKNKSKIRTIAIVVAVLVVGGIAFFVYNTTIAQPAAQKAAYENAKELAGSGDYDAAIAAFEELGEYEDSAQQLASTYEAKVKSLTDEGKYEEALEADKALEQAGGKSMKDEIRQTAAKEAEKNKEYDEAAKWYKSLGNTDKQHESEYLYVKDHMDYSDSKTKEFIDDLVGAEYRDAGQIRRSLEEWSFEFKVCHTKGMADIAEARGYLRTEWEKAFSWEEIEDVTNEMLVAKLGENSGYDILCRANSKNPSSRESLTVEVYERYKESSSLYSLRADTGGWDEFFASPFHHKVSGDGSIEDIGEFVFTDNQNGARIVVKNGDDILFEREYQW